MLDRAKLTADILVDMNLEDDKAAGLKIGAPTKCFLCRASYLYGGPDGDYSGRFCSLRCRDAYDHVGLRCRPPEAGYTLNDGHPITAVSGGFHTACRSCGSEFVSKGLAFCSDECRRIGETRQEAEAAGHEPRKGRTCIDCTARIPRYGPSGRATKATVLRCPACQRKAARAAQAA
jgi:hypothetical protein